ncbi:hypothetical protein [Streptomyces sp. NPDC006415]|uniref:hypothetical protein n=1 Tax=Streptomyces sp. NPDC006415 TaxID=3155351 RepID=UPI0033B99E76
MTTSPVCAVAMAGPKYDELSPADDNVWTRNSATQVARAAHTSTFQGITVSKDTIRYEAVIGARWDDKSTTDKAVWKTLDAFTITKSDDGVKYVTEDGVMLLHQGAASFRCETAANGTGAGCAAANPIRRVMS